MPRSVSEWIGKSDDARVPPRVRVRIFDRHGGVCALSGRKIHAGEAWDLDHIIALANGGEHRETNLQPVLKAPHREKTRADVAEKAKVAKTRARHIGAAAPKRTLPSRGFPKSERRREIGEKERQLREMRERQETGR